jgi:hypothetical protein
MIINYYEVFCPIAAEFGSAEFGSEARGALAIDKF